MCIYRRIQTKEPQAATEICKIIILSFGSVRQVNCASSVVLQLQEMRAGAARQSMEVSKTKDDCKDLRSEITDLRDKINDLDNAVRLSTFVVS
jgi:septal ring factor EnvC (AmiA/AmiB activator)